MKKHSTHIKHPDIHHSQHFEGMHIGGHDGHIHGKDGGSSHGMKNTAGTKACPTDEKFYAHIK